MERIILTLLVLTSSCSFSAKHVFIQSPLSWPSARDYCRDHHTDLAAITTDLEENLFRESVGQNRSGWIGLVCRPEPVKWRWSGGGGYNTEKGLAPRLAVGVDWTGSGWVPAVARTPKPFFCLNLVLVRESRTWDEAQDVCNAAHGDLASLLSRTENMLARAQVRWQDRRVWVGLRLLQGRWAWANGDPLEYEAWDQDNPGPAQQGCGALNKEARWETRSCQEKLHFICV